MRNIEAIISEVALLPPDQRLTLAHRILASVEPPVDPEIEKAWDKEIRERISRYDANPEIAISGEEAFAELDQKLKK